MDIHANNIGENELPKSICPWIEGSMAEFIDNAEYIYILFRIFF
uniref:Uncharacterized protein n=1 Tax=viral metagenome TaxID=1070528 RepID=A0A6C0BW50_9ZZZZ